MIFFLGIIKMKELFKVLFIEDVVYLFINFFLINVGFCFVFDLLDISENVGFLENEDEGINVFFLSLED